MENHTDPNLSVNTDKHHSFRYINAHGKEVEVNERTAIQIHSQMKKFLGRVDGSMEPPRGKAGKEKTIITPSGQEIDRKVWERSRY